MEEILKNGQRVEVDFIEWTELGNIVTSYRDNQNTLRYVIKLDRKRNNELYISEFYYRVKAI